MLFWLYNNPAKREKNEIDFATTSELLLLE